MSIDELVIGSTTSAIYTTTSFSDKKSSDQNPIPFDFTRFLIAAACVICIILSLVGNLLTVFVIGRFKRLKNATNYILLSLAITDITVSICVMLPAMIQDVMGKWIFSETFCFFYNVFDISCCTASILHLLLIAVDRYIAIFNPLRYRNTVRTWHIIVSVCSVWFISFGMSFFPIYFGLNKLPKPPGTTDTTTSYSSIIEHVIDNSFTTNVFNFRTQANEEADLLEEDKKCMLEANVTYSIISSSLSFFIPLIVMTIVYLQIYIVARRQSKAIERTIGGKRHFSNDTTNSLMISTNNATNDITNDANTDSQVCKFNKLMHQSTNGNNNNATHSSISTTAEDKKSRFLKLFKQLKIVEKKKTKDTKAIKTLGIIMGIFIACWLPFFIMYLYVPLNGGTPPPLLVDRLITWIGYVNSFINPIIYALTNRDFRKSYIASLKEASKKLCPKSFYYSTLGKNDVDSIYFISNKKNRKTKRKEMNQTNNKNDDGALICKFLNTFTLLVCCSRCKYCRKTNELNSSNNNKKENNSFIGNNFLNKSNKDINNNNNNIKLLNNLNNKVSDNEKNHENSDLLIENKDVNNNNSINELNETSNFKALLEDQSSLLYIDNESAQDLVVSQVNFDNDGSDDVFEQEIVHQNLSQNTNIFDDSNKLIESNQTITDHENNDENNNLFKKFRKSFKSKHNHVNHHENNKINIIHELEILKNDLDDVKDKMKDDNSSYFTNNTLNERRKSSSKDDSIFLNDDNSSAKINKTASQRLVKMFSFKKKKNHEMNNKIDDGLKNFKKNSLIYFKNGDQTATTKLVDSLDETNKNNITIFRI